MNARNIAPRLESRHQALEEEGGGDGGGREREGGREELLERYDIINIFVRPKTRCVRAKIVLTGQFDSCKPQNYFKP